MRLIKVGSRHLNLRFLIADEMNDGTEDTAHIPPGVVRVTMMRGKEFNLIGDDAETYRRLVDEACGAEGPAGDSAQSQKPSASVAHARVDPRTGQVLPKRPGRPTKKRG